jgi:hypothetical protein
VGTRAALGALALATLALGGCASTEEEPLPPEAWPLVFAEDFLTPEKLAGFEFTDRGAWRWGRVEHTSFLELHRASEYAPPHRSPLSIALLPELVVGDFDLELRLEQTGRDYGHRDLIVVLGFESPGRYLYVHLAPSPDENAHNVFVVDDAPRRNLLPPQAEGIDWGNGEWHTVRLERRLEEGTLRVFWDGREAPIFVVEDLPPAWGRLGFGSFDDTGRVTGLRVRAPLVRPVERDAGFVGG